MPQGCDRPKISLPMRLSRRRETTAPCRSPRWQSLERGPQLESILGVRKQQLGSDDLPADSIRRSLAMGIGFDLGRGRGLESELLRYASFRMASLDAERISTYLEP